MKHIAEQIKELRGLIPKEPDHIVVTWNPDSGEPKPEPPPGYKGTFIVVTHSIVETGEFLDLPPTSYERDGLYIRNTK